MKKRAFDLTLTLATAVLWIPLLVVCLAGILVSSGWPGFYISSRRVDHRRTIRLLKLRVMIRNAEKIANRDTVPVEGVRFLNIESDSPLYTRVGRAIEKFNLTELPQLFHVIAGRMSLIGSRPLPERVIEAIKEEHPDVEDRFRTRAGIAGPIQLIGRENVADEDRLDLEYRYCRVAANNYSVALDLKILLSVALIAARLRKPYRHTEVVEMLERYEHRSEELRPVPEPKVSPAKPTIADLGSPEVTSARTRLPKRAPATQAKRETVPS